MYKSLVQNYRDVKAKKTEQQAEQTHNLLVSILVYTSFEIVNVEL